MAKLFKSDKAIKVLMLLIMIDTDDDLSEALGSQDVPESGCRQKVS